MTNDEYQALKKRADDEHRENIAAIERVYRMTNPTGAVATVTTTVLPRKSQAEVPDSSPSKRINGKHGDSVGKGELLKAVRDAVRGDHGSFTILDVAARIESSGMKVKKPSIRPVLSKLQREGVIEAIEHGIGRTPSVYRLKKGV